MTVFTLFELFLRPCLRLCLYGGVVKSSRKSKRADLADTSLVKRRELVGVIAGGPVFFLIYTVILSCESRKRVDTTLLGLWKRSLSQTGNILLPSQGFRENRLLVLRSIVFTDNEGILVRNISADGNSSNAYSLAITVFLETVLNFSRSATA